MTGTYIPPNFPLKVSGLLVDVLSKAEVFAFHYRKIFYVPESLENRGDHKLKIQNAIDCESPNDGMAKSLIFDELNESIHTLKSNKAMGLVYIPNEFLIHMNEDSPWSLLHLFNNIWLHGIYPKP